MRNRILILTCGIGLNFAMAQSGGAQVLDWNQKHQMDMQADQEIQQRNQDKLQQTHARIMKVKQWYFGKYDNIPINISNGWHSAITTNNYDMIEDIAVYVMDNTLTKMKTQQGGEYDIKGKISKAKVSYPEVDIYITDF